MIDKRHLEKESFGRRFIDAFSDFFDFSGKEIICIVFLAASLTFFSTISYLSKEVVQPPSPADLPIMIEHLGFPFETLRMIHNFRAGNMPGHMSGHVYPVTIETVYAEVEWLGLIANFIVFALPLIVVVRVIARVKDEIDYRRYDRR